MEAPDSRCEDAIFPFNSVVHLIGCACGQGAKDRRCAQGPWVMRQQGIVSNLRKKDIQASWEAIIDSDDQPPLESVTRICHKLSETVNRFVTDLAFFTVIGGDHACAIGAWSGAANAIREKGPLGLIWFDAHMDSHIPETSPSGALHGMPLACLLGYGEKGLTHIDGPLPALLSQHVCLIGVRSFEPEEAALLKRLGVRIYFMPEIRRRGLAVVMEEALALVRRDTAGFGISIDLDVFDPNDCPGIGSPAPGGLRRSEMLAAIGGVRETCGFLGAEIAEFNPCLDRSGITFSLITDLLVTLLPKGNTQ